jgi:uncharacterized membrane protein
LDEEVRPMKETRWAAMVLLAFLGASGIAGGVPMIADPGGRPIGMPQSLLQYSPFHSFLIPGIILLTANGLLALWVLWMAFSRRNYYGWWTAMQGCVLLVWLVVECLMLRLVVWPHYLYGAVAVGLIAAGLALRRGGAGAAAIAGAGFKN